MIVVVPTLRASRLLAESSLEPATLRALAEHESRSVRVAVAENAATDDLTIEHLLADDVDVVRATAADALRGRPQLHEVAARSPDKCVRAILAHLYVSDDQRSLARAVQKVLAVDPFGEVRGRMAQTTDDLQIFEALLADPSPAVRALCASNPRISLRQMERLVTDRNRMVRAAAAANGLRYPDDEQLLRLARDKSAEVRWAVLFRPDRPRRAIELIAEDSDEMNRQHARIALRDERAIIAPPATRWARAERQRAHHVRSFDE